MPRLCCVFGLAALTAALFAPLACLGEDAASGLDAAADPLAAINAELGAPVTITAAIEPGAAGAADVLAVTATLEEGWHLYSVTQKPGPTPTSITVVAGSRQPKAPFVPDAPPHSRPGDAVPAWKGIMIEEHSGTVTWRAPLEPGAGGVSGTVRLQLCRETECLPPQTISFDASAAGPRLVASATHQPPRSHARIEAGFGAQRKAAGRSLLITLLPEPGWHLYAPASSAESDIGKGKPTIVAAATAESASGMSVVATQATPAVAVELAAAGAVEGPVTLEVTLPTAAGKSVELVIGFQTCSDRTCDAPTAVRLSLLEPEGAADREVIFTAARYGEAAEAPLPIAAAAATVRTRPDPGSEMAASPVAAAAGVAALSLPLALLMGLVGGLILNLMPCVLPVLGLKLMSFAQQSGRARREVFLMNLWYCAGVFAVFFVLATASVAANIGLASTNLGWGQQFGSVPFKIGMLGVVFAFALSFLGVWELPIPGFIGEKAGHVQSREGPLGSFLKGVLSTVLATPCSGPYLGTVFGYTLTQPTAVTYAVFGAIALGMSLPYIVVGLFPALVRFLPRPGAWMATFKELLGFVMLGTVAYLFYLLRQQHEWFVATFVMLVGIWLGCWWVGRMQESRGVAGFGRWVQAVVMAAAIGSAAFFMLGPHESLIPWEKPFSPARLAELRGSGSTVLVDFSADWCPTCKLNLATAIETSRVKAALEKNHVVPVLADWSDGSDEIRRVLESLGSRSIPLLAIYPAAKPGAPLPEPIILRDLLTEPQVLEAIERAGPSCCPPPEIRAAGGTAVPSDSRPASKPADHL